MCVYQNIFQAKNKSMAVLLDPDKPNPALETLAKTTNPITEVSAFFVGGSLVPDNSTAGLVRTLKQHSHKPVVLFPGNVNQVCKADAILFLSLISGRNPEYLIGQHITGAPLIKQLNMEAIATGYMLIGEPSSTTYVSNTNPLPAHKNDLAIATALAGQMLGHKLIYMDAGSGTSKPVPPAMIAGVAEALDVPLIIGGGIRTYEDAKKALDAGAHCIVIGNAAETNPDILFEIAEAVYQANAQLNVH